MIIDISKHNGKVDWGAAKPYIEGAILRLGYGSDLKKQDDSTFEYNASECERLGIPWGAYLYSYAKNTAQAKSEAEHAIRLLFGKNPQLPVFFDSEERGTEGAAASCAKAFLERIQAAGYVPGIYASDGWYKVHLSGAGLPIGTVKWIARYSSSLPTVKGAWLWQYSSQAACPGVRGRVDASKVIDGNAFQPRKPGGGPAHVQLAYRPGRGYCLAANMNVRSSASAASRKNLVGKTLPRGTWVLNNATCRDGDKIWMFIGRDKVKGKWTNQWVCADDGTTAYAVDWQV